MNVYDSERILEALDKKGITETKDSNESDSGVIFNTCHIRERQLRNYILTLAD